MIILVRHRILQLMQQCTLSKDAVGEYGHPKGHGTDLHALHVAESRRRSRSITGALRGEEYQKHRYQQAVELDRVMNTMSGG